MEENREEPEPPAAPKGAQVRLKVSQAGSQTSTANIERERGTATVTQNSICGNSNLVGGGSLEIGTEEPKLN